MTPGSDEAVKAGCTCPVLDNWRGRGAYQIDGVWHFWFAFDCPVHEGVAPMTDESEGTPGAEGATEGGA